MNSIVFRKLYDFYILKPFWLLFIVLTVFYLYHQDWLSGILFALVWWFGIGGIGGKLYLEMSPKELARGHIPSKEEVAYAIKGELSPEESYLVSKAHTKLSLLIGFSTLVMLLHYELRWYFIILLAILIGYIAYILTIAWWMIILFVKRKLSK